MATIEVGYPEARERLAELWDRVLTDRRPIRLTRHDSAPVILIAEDDYEGLVETAHLLRSPANAARLLAALEQARAGVGTPRTVAELRAEFDRDEE